MVDAKDICSYIGGMNKLPLCAEGLRSRETAGQTGAHGVTVEKWRRLEARRAGRASG